MIDWKTYHERWSPRLLSVLRIVVALLFMQHGSQKLIGFPGKQPVQGVALFSLIGIAGVLELFGGMLLLIGSYTRPVAFVLFAEMVVAYFKAHAPSGFWPLLNRGELAFLYGAVFLYFIAAGGGAWSVDALMKSNKSRSHEPAAQET